MHVGCIPIQGWLLLVALLLGLLTRSRASPTRTVAHDHTIFVCLVGSDAHMLESASAHLRSTAMYPHSVSVGAVVLVDRSLLVDEVARTTEGNFMWKYAANPRHALMRARATAMRKLYNRERFILMLHAARPVQGWDDACIRLIDDAPDGVLCAFPHVADREAQEGSAREREARDGAAFPSLRLYGEVVKVEHTPFAVRRMAVVRSTAFSRRFAFAPCEHYARMRKDAFHDSQLEQTVVLYENGLRCLVAAVPLCESASRCGVGADVTEAQRVSMEEAAFGAHPGVGIVDERDVEELITKYGSVDVAKVAIQSALVKMSQK